MTKDVYLWLLNQEQFGYIRFIHAVIYTVFRICLSSCHRLDFIVKFIYLFCLTELVFKSGYYTHALNVFNIVVIVILLLGSSIYSE